MDILGLVLLGEVSSLLDRTARAAGNPSRLCVRRETTAVTEGVLQNFSEIVSFKTWLIIGLSPGKP